MSVMPFEGTHPILFSGARVTDGSRIRDAYLSRPDLSGSYASVALVSPIGGITSSVKDLARRIARHGIAVLAMDPYRGKVPARATAEQMEEAHAAVSDTRAARDVAGVVRWLRSPGTEWADPDRLGLWGIGTGGRWALQSAGELPIEAVAVCYSPLADVLDSIGAMTQPLLGIYGRADEVVPVEDVTAARAAQPRSEWAIYEDAGHGFLDDGIDAYDPAAAKDALERLVKFFQESLA